MLPVAFDYSSSKAVYEYYLPSFYMKLQLKNAEMFSIFVAYLSLVCSFAPVVTFLVFWCSPGDC